jgi:Pvc16 N-terminal domain/IPT/TIG domain
MSTALAIGAVTAVLQDLLNNGMIDHNLQATVGDVLVTALAPDRIPTGDGVERSQLNLFMYQVMPNQGWRNFGLPSHDSQGLRTSNPPLALDLHYLLTAYGAQELHMEILLGYAMQLLHETPILTRDAIRTTLGPPSILTGGTLPPNLQALATSELADQVEQIKICPYSLSTEEISRFWTAFMAHYRPTAVYEVSVVLIESRRSTKPTLPVRVQPVPLVVPLNRPIIDSLSPQIVRIGEKLTIQGQNLKSIPTKNVQLEFGTGPVPPDTVSATQIEFTLTSPLPTLTPSNLICGVNSVQVNHLINFGVPTPLPSDPHRGFESNVAAFILAPTILSPAPPFTVTRGSTLTLTVTPPVGRSQRVVLLVGEQSIIIPSRSDTTTTLDFPFPSDFPTGTYLLRVQIDGADSALDVDTDQNSPTFNQYIGPKVTVS